MDLGWHTSTGEYPTKSVGDFATTLVYGSPEDIKEETKRCIETLSPGGGHILSSTNSINLQVKPENFLAMLEAGRKYGKYKLKQ